MRIVVTGSQGYVGSVIVCDLAGRGHDVVGLDAGWWAEAVLGERLDEPPTRRVDVRDLGPHDFDGVDALVHLAALSNDPLGDLRPEATHAINTQATATVARAAREAGVGRFLFLSSCSVYGSHDERPIDEAGAVEPLTPYARSKVEAEAALMELARPGFVPIVLRSATVFGPSPRIRLDLVVNDFVATAHTQDRVVVRSAGTAYRPLIHVADLAECIARLLVLDDEAGAGVLVNVGSPETSRVIDLARAVGAAYGCPVEVADRRVDHRSYRVDFGRLASLLPELQCRRTVSSGIDDLRRAFDAAGLDRRACESSRYRRVPRLRELVDRGILDDRLRVVRDPCRSSRHR